MKKISIRWAMISLSVSAILSGAACSKDKCEEAADILKDCGGAKLDSSSDKCDEKDEKIAQCVIDNKKDACEFYKEESLDSLNTNSAFFQCLNNVLKLKAMVHSSQILARYHESIPGRDCHKVKRVCIAFFGCKPFRFKSSFQHFQWKYSARK